jgi:hypothetical protein
MHDKTSITITKSHCRRKSLIDDHTAVATAAVQPSDYTVVAESCEWCLSPWNAGDEDNADTNSITQTDDEEKREAPTRAPMFAPKMNTNFTSETNMTKQGSKLGSSTMWGKKTFGVKMI